MSSAEFIYTVLLRPPLLKKCANYILRAFLPETIKVHGATLHLNPSDPVVSGALAFRIYEREEIDFFTTWFEPGMTFVDVGANIGLYTGLALHKSPRGSKILCIEPDETSGIYLRRTIGSNQWAGQLSNVTIRHLAASDTREKLILYKNSQNKGDNRIYADPLCDGQQAVETDTLDHLCEQAGIESINFLKIDVQGAEFKVMKGAGQILSRSPDCIVMTEFWPYGLGQCGCNPRHYLSLLQDFGFTIYELSGKTLEKVQDFEDLISRCPGRVYRNLICLKGRFVR